VKTAFVLITWLPHCGTYLIYTKAVSIGALNQVCFFAKILTRRQAVQQYGGDRVLLELDDEALDGSLGLTMRRRDGSRLPTLTGLLLVGRETALHRQFLNTPGQDRPAQTDNSARRISSATTHFR
jgi:hypothetical protein